jgi:hypothetical protein
VSEPASPPPSPAKPTLKQRAEKLMADYGAVAVTVYFVIFFATLAGFAVAIRTGVAVESAAGEASILGAAWVATKVTQPVRILATLALTPLVGRAWQRLRRRS